MTLEPERQLAQIAERKRMLEEEERREGDLSFWKGMSMIGAIGWMISLPTIGGAALGWWIQNRYESPYAWSITLMLIGLAFGCYTAWKGIGKA